MTNLLMSNGLNFHIKSRIWHCVPRIFYATFRSHKTIRSMHRCPPQLDRPLLNPKALVVPKCSFIFCSTAVLRPRATFSHRNRDILSRIARVSCDPFFPSPWRVHWGRASCTAASQSARGKLVKVLYFSHNSVSINSTCLEQNSNIIVTIPT